MTIISYFARIKETLWAIKQQQQHCGGSPFTHFLFVFPTPLALARTNLRARSKLETVAAAAAVGKHLRNILSSFPQADRGQYILSPSVRSQSKITIIETTLLKCGQADNVSLSSCD